MELGHSATVEIITHDVEAVAPLVPEYRTLPITEGFDWPRILEALAPRQLEGDPLYLVVFRSARKDDADAGDVDEAGLALSWCLWTSQHEARAALHGAAHQQAVRHAPAFYEAFSIETYQLYSLEGEAIFDRQHAHR